MAIKTVPEHLNKWLLLYTTAGMFLGLLLGYLDSTWTTAHLTLVGGMTTAAVFFVIYPMMVNLKIESLIKAGKNIKGLSLTTLYNFLWAPLIGALSAAIIFAVIVSTGFAAEETRVRWISIEKLQQVIEEQEPVIVDLRTPEEFRRGGIPGAINIPIETLRSDRSVLDAHKGKPLLLYCRTVNKTDRALWLLDKRGFKSIYALKGGYEAYRIQN
ncbi:MAG TPA: rhodanese-like domain-containing protein [Smithellaceae bacterium]|jgi:rhodanese-related sulfurtransferase|nr:rhodanese-like domain-containing protein [Smithellaceae bacterium]